MVVVVFFVFFLHVAFPWTSIGPRLWKTRDWPPSDVTPHSDPALGERDAVWPSRYVAERRRLDVVFYFIFIFK